MSNYPSFVTFQKTAVDNLPTHIEVGNVWLKYADLIVVGNDGVVCDQLGNTVLPVLKQTSSSSINIYEYPYPVQLGDIWARNYVSGQNITMIVSGTLLTQKEMIDGGFQ